MFINTMDKFGDEATMDMIIERTITEYCDDTAEKIGPYAFYGCKELAEVNVPNVTHIGEYAFANCQELTTLDIPNVINVASHAVYNCKSLTEIKLHRQAEQVAYGAFEGCANLIKADIGKANFGNQEVFRYCSSLTTLIMRRPGVCSFFYLLLGGTSIASGTGYIYVPAALVDSYKAATNWASYGDQFRALEDYTVDGTVDGELDETKI